MGKARGWTLVGAALVTGLLQGAASTAGSATLEGILRDDRGAVVAGARVVLASKAQSYRQVAVSDAGGRYRFTNVPFHEYHLDVEAEGLAPAHQDVELRSALPLALNLVLRPAGAVVAVEESANLVESHPSTHMDIDRAAILTAPAAVQSRAMESILLSTPGFIQDENGRFHFRGSHGQVTYVVDGIPVSDQMQATFSNAMDPAQAESLEVITGGISAEYGGKPVAVVNVTTRSGLGSAGVHGDVSVGVSRFGTREAAFSSLGGGETSGWFVNGSASSSDRFLDPVTFENLHNTGATGNLHGRFDWMPTAGDTLRLSLGGGRTDRDVADLPSQDRRGQDQRVATQDASASLAWTHLLDPSRSVESSLWFRHATQDLSPSRDLAPGFDGQGPDFPVWARQSRSLDNLGAQVAFNQRFQGGSTLKAGLQLLTFPIREAFAFALTDDAMAPEAGDPLHAYTPAGGGAIFQFQERIRPMLASAYVQDDLHLGNWFLAAGLRYDRYSVRDRAEHQLQPRLGLSYRVPGWGTVLRASYDRLLVTPENENLALTTSQTAWDLGPGQGTPVPALACERQDSFSYGVEQQVGSSIRMMVEYWEKRSRNAADSEQFLNTGVLFPVAADRGLFHGMNARFEWIPVAGFSGSLALGRTRAVFQAPTVGGLQLEMPERAPGERFLIDHDQKLSAQLTLKYEKKGTYIQINGRYDSGLVAGDPGAAKGNPDLEPGLPYVRMDSEGTWRISPRYVWNLGAGRTISLPGGRALLAGIDVLNLMDEKGLYNFLSAFGGTHVIPPRTVAARLKYRF